MKTFNTAAIITISIIAAACGSGGSSSTSSPTPQTQSIATTTPATSPASGSPSAAPVTPVSSSVQSSSSPAPSPTPTSLPAAPSPSSPSVPPSPPASGPVLYPVSEILRKGLTSNRYAYNTGTCGQQGFVASANGAGGTFYRSTLCPTLADDSGGNWLMSGSLLRVTHWRTVPVDSPTFRSSQVCQYTDPNLSDANMAPAFAPIGSTGTFGDCEKMETPTLYIGPAPVGYPKHNGTDRVSWWTEQSTLAGHMLVCIALQSMPSSGVCFRGDVSGNLNEDLPPWANQ